MSVEPQLVSESDLDPDSRRILFDAVSDEVLRRIAPRFRGYRIPGGRPGEFEHLCKRCGYQWNHRLGSPNPPRICAWCYSCYWQEPAKTRRGRRPENTNWPAEAKARAERQRVSKRDRMIQKAGRLMDEMRREGLLPTGEDVRTSRSVQVESYHAPDGGDVTITTKRPVLPPPPDMRGER